MSDNWRKMYLRQQKPRAKVKWWLFKARAITRKKAQLKSAP